MGKTTVEYKETKVFDLFPEIEYTRRQRMRCVLFHAYAKNVTKIINYAKNFDVPNKICLVYIIGEPKPEKIMKALEEADCSSNVCVLTCPFSKEEMAVYDARESVKEKYLPCGFWDKERNDATEWFRKQHEQYKRNAQEYGCSDQLKEQIEKTEHEFECLEQYEELKARVRKTNFTHFRLYRRDCLPKPFTLDKLDKLIQKIFPYGTEAQGINDLSALSPAVIDKAVRMVKTGEKNGKFGFTVDDDTPLVRCMNRCINKHFLDEGYCSVKDLSEAIRQPPYGAMPCAYTAACLTKALQKYDGSTLLFRDKCNVILAKDLESLLAKFLFMNDSTTPMTRDLFSTMNLFIESHPHKVIKRMIHEVFRVKMEVPTTKMITSARHKLAKKYRYPLSAADERLYELLDIGWSWYDRAAVQELCDKIDGQTDELIDAMFRFRSEDRKLKGVFRMQFPECSSWLWNREFALDYLGRKEEVLAWINYRAERMKQLNCEG